MAFCRINGSFRTEFVIASNHRYSRLGSHLQAYFILLNQCIGGVYLVKYVCVRLDQKHDNGENRSTTFSMHFDLAGEMNGVGVN